MSGPGIRELSTAKILHKFDHRRRFDWFDALSIYATCIKSDYLIVAPK